MAPDHPPHQPLVAHVIQAPFLPVALAGGVDQGQVAGLAGFEKILFQGHGDFLGKPGADKTAGGDGVPVADDLHRFPGGDDLSLEGPLRGQGRQHRMGAAGLGGIGGRHGRVLLCGLG